MPTVAELARRKYQECATLFAVDGVPWLWTDCVDICGTGPASWIGTSEGAGRVVRLGLEPPASVSLGINLLDSGMLGDDDCRVTIRDQFSDLIGWVADDAGTAVYERVTARDDPAPASVVGEGGDAVSLWGAWLNGERIGTDGARARYQCVPGAPFAPADHVAVDGESDTIRASVVHTSPRIFEGARCALYVLRRDPATGAFASWADQYAGGAMVYWGTVRRVAGASGRVWSFDLEGPSSLLRRGINMTRSSTWKPLEPLLELEAGEDLFAAAFEYGDTGTTTGCGYSAYDAVDDKIPTPATAAEVAAFINARLQVLATAAGVGGSFTDLNGEVSFAEDALTLRVDDNGGALSHGGVLNLRMSRKVWEFLGWSPAVQGRPSPLDLTTEYAFEARTNPPAFFAGWQIPPLANDPGVDFAQGTFRTLPVGVNPYEKTSLLDGNGATRTYRALRPAGTSALYGSGGQRLSVGLGNTDYLDGQLARPVADKTIEDVGVADQTGFAAVRGTWRTVTAAENGEPVDESHTRIGIAKVSWKQGPGWTVAQDSKSRAILWLESWLDSKQYGERDGALVGTWRAVDHEWCPIGLLAYRTDYPDAAYAVLLRLMLGTGTAGPWVGYEGDPAATIAAGVGDHPDAGAGSVANDLEAADLSLAIPPAFVDLKSFGAAAAALPGGAGGPLARTRVALLGPTSAFDLIEAILKPRAWALGLNGGKYTLIPLGQPLDVADSVATLTTSDIAGGPDDLPPGESVVLCPFEPFDAVRIRYGRSQLGGDTEERELRIVARDPRAATRRGGNVYEIDGWTLPASLGWQPAAMELWGERMARWRGEPHMLVTLTVQGDRAVDLWPGSVVRLSNPTLPNRNGSYGLDKKLGRIVKVTRNLRDLSATLEVLVAGGDPLTPRRHAPIARLVDAAEAAEERHEPSSRTLRFMADAFGSGGAASDVRGFAEPDYLGVGGDCLAYVWASRDGVEWSKVAEFTVEAVDEAAHTITYAAGSLVGGIPERRFCLVALAPWEDQAPGSWPRSLYGVWCGFDNKFGASNTPGFAWVEG